MLYNLNIILKQFLKGNHDILLTLNFRWCFYIKCFSKYSTKDCEVLFISISLFDQFDRYLKKQTKLFKHINFVVLPFSVSQIQSLIADPSK